MQSIHYCGCNLPFTGFGVVLSLLTTGVLLRLHGAKASKTATLDKYLHWMYLYGKWSMLDVFMVTVLVVSMKPGAITSVEVRYGYL
jgi:paraquat-inducible protein A